MKDRWAKRRLVQELLTEATQCAIQHTGWPCNTCFHYLETKLDVGPDDLHAMWHAVLVLRGDYKSGQYGIVMPPQELEVRVDALIELLQTAREVPQKVTVH